MKILHTLSSLESNGAEWSCLRLLKANQTITHYLISLNNKDTLTKKFKPITDMLLTKSYKKPIKLLRFLFNVSREIKNDEFILMGWLYHGSFFTIFLSLIFKKNCILYLHHTNLNPKYDKFTTLILIYIIGILSHLPWIKVIFSGNSSKKIHEKIGYKKGGIILPPMVSKNFFIKPVETYLNNKNSFSLISISRWDPIKDIPILLESFKKFLDKKKEFQKDIKLTLIGYNLDKKNKNLLDILHKLDLFKNVDLLGRVSDVKEILIKNNVSILTSKSEANPNAISESMAAGIPCIATNVGDCAEMLSGNGWICSTGNINSISLAIESAFNEYYSNKEKWNNRRRRCYENARTRYSQKCIAEKFNEIINSF